MVVMVLVPVLLLLLRLELTRAPHGARRRRGLLQRGAPAHLHLGPTGPVPAHLLRPRLLGEVVPLALSPGEGEEQSAPRRGAGTFLSRG